MTYNILHGSGLDGAFDLERTAEVIRQANPDVVGLNEVDRYFDSRSHFLNEPQQLAQQLGMHYVYGANLDRGTPAQPRQYGNAILSRYPIQRWRNHKLYRHAAEEQRGCLLAEIEIAGSHYTFLTTHLDHQSPPARVGQVKDILALVASDNERVVVLGDLNCEPPRADRPVEQTRPIAMLAERFIDTFSAAGTGPGATHHRGSRIDYIFVSPDLKDDIITSTVIRTPLTAVASDHLPVLTEIALPPPGRQPTKQTSPETHGVAGKSSS